MAGRKKIKRLIHLKEEACKNRKSDYRNRLLKNALKGRTPGSFERMQNISFVLDSLIQVTS
jgi:hypothetical protein